MRARRSLGMMVVRGRVEHVRRVALAADLIAHKLQLARMGIVAIRTGDPGRMHAALREGGEIIDLVALLAVRIIKARRQRRGMEGVVIMQRVARGVGELPAA